MADMGIGIGIVVHRIPTTTLHSDSTTTTLLLLLLLLQGRHQVIGTLVHDL